MSTFWLVAAVMIAAAIAFVVRPLIRPSLPLSPWSAFAAAIVLPAVAIGWYLKYGAGPDALSEAPSSHPGATASQAPQNNVGSVASMIAKLEERLESSPATRRVGYCLRVHTITSDNVRKQTLLTIGQRN